MDRQDYVIEVSHVSKSFKDNKVLKDVSLLCESGKIYGLVGHNGSGKTVLFKSICGFLSCDEGTITVNGKVMGKDKDMLTDAGIIIEDPGFLRTWSGYHNLEFLYTLRNKKNKDYLCSVLRKVGLDPANPEDRNRTTEVGYTALEVYLNSLVGESISYNFKK